MAGNNPREAVSNFVDPLQRALWCVTDKHLNCRGQYYERNEPFALTLGDGLPLPLKPHEYGAASLLLSFTMWYRIGKADGSRGPWKVTTTGYDYSLDDEQEQNILAYHWHPSSQGWASFPHLHIGSGAKVGFKPLINAHLRTERIALEEFLWVVIDELGVQPLDENWKSVLTDSLELFRKYRTWPKADIPVE